MKILVIGQGGREHAIAWKLAQSQHVQTIYVAPGNGGTQLDDRLENVALHSIDEIIAFVKSENIQYTIVGPEAYLAQGIVNRFKQEGLSIFGPTQQAAQLESSKAFAKNIMQKYHIPTAQFAVFDTQSAAQDYLNQHNMPVVLKADGLASGKGVFICQNLVDAEQALHKIFTMPAGAKVVIEEFLQGEEASFIVMVDGKNILPLATSQDHKRLLDNDEGPNTGGMGAYSPAPIVTPSMHAKIMREIIEPTIKAMENEGISFTGFLYAGLMIQDQNVKVLEFNCRLGDPEAQVIMARMKSDFAEILKLAAQQRLHEVEMEWDRRFALGVVLACKDYPDVNCDGLLIHQQNYPSNAQSALSASDVEKENSAAPIIFHAGTYIENQKLYARGGRILCVLALNDNIKQAQKHVYDAIRDIDFDGMQYRKDIGFRALK